MASMKRCITCQLLKAFLMGNEIEKYGFKLTSELLAEFIVESNSGKSAQFEHTD